MKLLRDLDGGYESPEASPIAPGKSSVTSRLVQRKAETSAPPPVQLATEPPRQSQDDPFGMHLLDGEGDEEVDDDDLDDDHARATAAAGVAGAGEALPYGDQIQAMFGAHDVSQVRAHTGPAASSAADALGARAYATGKDVAFGGTPDLHTAAHEAAHVVQQRAGVKLKSAVGEEGDAYEQHADAVADAVVRGQSAVPLLDSMVGDQPRAAATTDAVQRRKRKKAKKLKVQIKPREIMVEVGKSTKVYFDAQGGRPPKKSTWGFTNSDSDTASVTEPKKAKDGGLGEVSVTVTGNKTGGATLGAVLLTPTETLIDEAPIRVVSKQWQADHENVLEQYAENMGGSFYDQLIMWGSMWDPDVMSTYVKKAKKGTGDQDEYTQGEAVRTARNNLGKLFVQKIRANPTALLESLFAFRQDPLHEQMLKLDDFKEHDDALTAAVSDGIEKTVKDKVRPILKKAKHKRGTLLQPIANTLTEEALAPWRHVDEDMAEFVRRGFYSAVKELFAESGERAVAVCFIHAMTDMMVANANATELRNEVPDVALELATMAQDDDERVEDREAMAVNLAADTAEHEKSNIMDRQLQRHSVEILYTKLYLGIRQALQSVGAQWIEARTQGLKDDIKTLTDQKTWVGRGVNVAWAACPGPAVAIPVVLIGTLVDVLWSAAAEAKEAEKEKREAAMHAELDRRLGESMGKITKQAAEDYKNIAKDEAALSAIEKNVFQSIGEIESLYSDALAAELSALPRDKY